MDGQTGAKLQGAEFSLYKDNGEYVGSYTTVAGIATGDDSNMALSGLLSLIAGAGLVGLFVRRRLF